MTVHPHAQVFDAAAEDYELGRPGYPDALLDWIEERHLLDEHATVVDLGAGTGKLTRLLLRGGARVIALEPMPQMRDLLVRNVPEAEIVEGAAERMPLPDAGADVVACGQSFRWFASDEALGEIARILRPGGELLIVFNDDDGSSPLGQRLREISLLVDDETADKKPGRNWREVVDANELFAFVEEGDLANPYRVDRAGLEARMRSSTQFARLAPARQQELLAELYELVGAGEADLPQVTTVTRLRRG